MAGPENAPPTPPAAGAGEIWEGFVLLPEEAPIPPFVTCAPAPILGQTDGSPEAEVLRGETLTFPNLEPLRPLIRFPLYGLSRQPSGIEEQSVTLTRFRHSGQVFSVSLSWGDREGVPRIQLIAQPIYPSPYPVWPVYRPERPEEPIFPEKVFFTPRPGLQLPSAQGHLVLWQEAGVLYIRIAEHDPRREAVIAICSFRESRGI